MRLSLPAPPDFSFAETLSAHGWRLLPPFAWDEETQTLGHVDELPDGRVVQFRLFAQANQVIGEVLGEGTESEFAARVQRMLQMDVPLSAFHEFCRGRPELAPIPTRRQGRMLRCPTLFEDTVKVIATVNTTWAQTIAMTARLVDHFGAPLASDPQYRAFPTPQRLAAVPFEEFAALAKMGYRNGYVYQIATDIAQGRLDIEAWQDEGLSADALRKRLLSLPGVGPYASACLMLYLGKPEHVNVDSWARMLLSKEWDRPVTDKEVHAFFEGYGPWRGLVYNFYPWKPDEAE